MVSLEVLSVLYWTTFSEKTFGLICATTFKCLDVICSIIEKGINYTIYGKLIEKMFQYEELRIIDLESILCKKNSIFPDANMKSWIWNKILRMLWHMPWHNLCQCFRSSYCNSNFLSFYSTSEEEIWSEAMVELGR